jgi:hypothetical protein
MAVSQQVRTVFAKDVASQWIRKISQAEFRFDILWGPKDIHFLPTILRAFRDGRTSLENVRPIPDLGISETDDKVSVWGTNRESLVSLKDWLERRGYETSGVW